MTDGSSTFVWRAEYQPFGETDLTVSDKTNNLRFPGQYFDVETGLHQNWFRDYAPKTGRYAESDPIGIDGGSNTYLYSGGNPATNFDPVGLDWIEYTGQQVSYYAGNYGDQSKLIRQFPATSGRLNWQDVAFQGDEYKFVGPVTAGEYRINLSLDPSRTVQFFMSDSGQPDSYAGYGIQQLPESTQWGDFRGSWGTWRARLERVRVPDSSRDNVYFHNSHKGESHGCVETGSGLQDLMRKYRLTSPWIYVRVRYTSTSTRGNTKW